MRKMRFHGFWIVFLALLLVAMLLMGRRSWVKEMGIFSLQGGARGASPAGGLVPAAVPALISEKPAVRTPFNQVSSLPAPRRLLPTPESTWNRPGIDVTFARFNGWLERFELADADARGGMVAEGVLLARERRSEMVSIVRTQPRLALELAVPRRVRSELPDALLEFVEQRISGRGDLTVLAALTEPGREGEVTPLSRRVTLGEQEYEAFVYGRRESESTRYGIPLNGVAIDGLLAVDENAGRILEASELAAWLAGNPDPRCGITGQSAESQGSPLGLESGERVVVACSSGHAEQLNEQWIAAESDGGPEDVEGRARLLSAYTEGIKGLIFIRVDFSDLSGEPFGLSAGTNMVKALNEFYSVSSYGRTGFHRLGDGSEVTETFRMPKTAAAYGKNDANGLRSAARAAARAAGYVLENYNFDLICMGSVPGFSWAGLGVVGGPGAWIRSSFGSDGGVVAHELGHNYGLNHANFWDTAGKSVIGHGASVEYGDPYDTMGNASAGRRHFNARYKNYLNWLPNASVFGGTSNGTYRIFAHDQTNVAGFRALRVPKNSQTNYWIEARQLFTTLPSMMSGVTLRWARTGNQSSLLLDTTPGSADGKNDAAITVGRTFSDKASGVHITPVGTGTDGAHWVDVVVQRNPPTNNAVPIPHLEASSTRVPINTGVDFTVTASDPDGDAIAYFWDFGDGTLSSNLPTVQKRWSSSGDYVVRCVVSDMKGGTSSSSVLVRVGSPTTLRIAGRVLLNGQGVDGVRVYISNTKATYTDADGQYFLTGLSRGSYSLKASAENLLFTRKNFSNPIELTNSDSVYDFEAQPPGSLAMVALIAAGAEWKYLDGGTVPSSDWKVLSFDDQEWNQGAAQLGYGDDDVVTRLNFGTAANKFLSYYFRRSFVVDDPSSFLSVNLGIIRDDGAVVYLNGKEVFRSNMPSGPVSSSTRASSTVGGTDELTYYETDLDPAMFHPGTNLIAVEVHQSEPDSSDLSFNLQLTGLHPLPTVALPTLSAQVVDGVLRIHWLASDGYALEASDSLGAGASWGLIATQPETLDGENFVMLPLDQQSSYFRLITQ
ncbi:MAG: PKD domain-containing protein [Pedosphaera sp.]|nr:PKD domain-containing protein [Pedosphaera sp.]